MRILLTGHLELGLTVESFQQMYKRLPVLRRHREGGLLDDMLRWT